MTIVKNIKAMSLITVLGLTIFSNARADIITFPSQETGVILDASKISYAGTGCTEASVRITPINDKAVILTHPGFSGSIGSRSIVRETCMVRIPVSVPEGYQVALQAASTGRVELGAQDTLTLNREVFVAGSQSRVQSRVYKGELNQRLQLLEQAESKLSFSGCGQDSILAMNFSALLRDYGRSEIASNFSLNKTVLRLVVRKCN